MFTRTEPQQSGRSAGIFGGLLDGLFVTSHAAPPPSPDGLPWAARQVIDEMRARDEAEEAVMTEDECIMHKTRGYYYDLWLRQRA
jgi:hypothetical protein